MVESQTNAGIKEFALVAPCIVVALQRRHECLVVSSRLCACEHLLLPLHGTGVAVGVRSSQCYGIDGARLHAEAPGTQFYRHDLPKTGSTLGEPFRAARHLNQSLAQTKVSGISA